MKRIPSPTVPTAAAFFGRQSSSDGFDQMKMASESANNSTKQSCGLGQNQVAKKQAPVRSISLRDLAASLSWNKSIGGHQKSSGIFGNKVDNATKQPSHSDEGQQHNQKNLKPPPVYSIEVMNPPSLFLNTLPRQEQPLPSFFGQDTIPPSSNSGSVVPLGMKPPPEIVLEERMKRVPPAVFPSDSMDCTLPSRGSVDSHQHTQFLCKGMSKMSVIDRPHKPHRQYSKMTSSRPNQPPSQVSRDHQSHQPSTSQHRDFSHRRYHMRQFQQDCSQNHCCRDLQGNPRVTTAQIPTPRDDRYESSAFDSYPHGDNYGMRSCASTSSNGLKNPPTPIPPLTPLSPLATFRPVTGKSAFSPVVSTSQRKKDPVYIEIFPGNTQILRGADETNAAIEKNFVNSCKCISCATEHLCIANAAFVICPECRCVSQAPDHALKEQYGVGLGFLPP